ncbi:MAG: hypothetical protein GVY13_05715 [Alphaproteobacteria bacterium]|nr:hypothetical protein [Alphaproteobacteria bacterium]
MPEDIFERLAPGTGMRYAQSILGAPTEAGPRGARFELDGYEIYLGATDDGLRIRMIRVTVLRDPATVPPVRIPDQGGGLTDHHFGSAPLSAFVPEGSLRADFCTVESNCCASMSACLNFIEVSCPSIGATNYRAISYETIGCGAWDGAVPYMLVDPYNDERTGRVRFNSVTLCHARALERC